MISGKSMVSEPQHIVTYTLVYAECLKGFITAVALHHITPSLVLPMVLAQLSYTPTGQQEGIHFSSYKLERTSSYPISYYNLVL